MLTGPEESPLRVEIEQTGLELLQRAEELLDRKLTAADVGEMFIIGLRSWVARMERKRRAAVPKPRPRCGRRASARGIPGRVRSAVWERDGGQCTFVGTAGHRCTSRRLLEFDRIGPMDGENEAGIEGLRLLCHTHFQYEAERAAAIKEESETDV